MGEDGQGTVAKVTPLGLGAATAALGAAAAATTAVPVAGATSGGDAAPADSDLTGSVQSASATGVAATAALRMDDTLAPGARLGFGGEPTRLAGEGPHSDEFFMGSATAAVPVARSSTRVPPAPVPRRDGPAKESRGARRRRLGIPRRITPRVIGFVLLVAAVPVAAYFVLRWYAYDNWTVTLQGDQIVVKQGQVGGVLWFHPKVVDRTGFTTSQIPVAAVAPVRAGIQEPSLSAARAYVRLITATTTSTTTTTTTRVNQAPPPAAPTPTAPTATTTVPVTATTAAGAP